jgi:hypothetical protein
MKFTEKQVEKALELAEEKFGGWSMSASDVIGFIELAIFEPEEVENWSRWGR